MVSFTVLFLVISALIPQDALSKISDKRLCANKDCTERISLARTTILYNSPEKGLLSVPQNVEVIVYSKSAGSNMDLWGIEYKGKRGYLNKNFLKETRVIKKDLQYLIDTELAELEKVPSSNILPNKQTYEVIDGTTIILNPNDINPTATEENLQPTENVQHTQESGVGNDIETEQEMDHKKKAASMVQNVISKISNLFDGTNNEDSGRKEEPEEADDEDSEEIDDETEDIDEEDGDEDINIEAEKIEEELIVKIPQRYKENEEINLSIEQPDVEEKLIDNEKNKDLIIEGDSVTLRNLLQEKENVDDVLSPNDVVTDNENKSDDQNKVLQGNVNTDTIQETSEKVQVENVPTTTESFLDVPYDTFEDIESVTPNPGKVDANEVSSEQIVADNANNNQNAEQIEFGETKKEQDDATTSNESKEIPFDTLSSDTLSSEQVLADNSENKQTDSFLKIDNIPPKTINVIPDKQKSEDIESSQNMNSTEETNPSFAETNEVIQENKLEEISSPEKLSSEPIVDQENRMLHDSVDLNSTFDNSQHILLENRQNIISESVETLPNVQQSLQDELNSNEQFDIPHSAEQNSDDVNPENPTQTIHENPTDTITANPTDNNIENPIETIPGNPPDNKFENPTETISGNPNEIAPENKEEGGLSGLYNSWFGGDDTTANVEDRRDRDNENSNQKPEITQEHQEYVDDDTNASDNNKNIIESENPNIEQHEHNFWSSLPLYSQPDEHDHLHKENDVPSDDSIDHGTCSIGGNDCSDILSSIQKQLEMDFSDINFTDVLNLVAVLGITGVTVVIFLLGYIAIDKSRREAPLIAKINKLEKALLVSTKENQILTEKVTDCENDTIMEKDVTSSTAYTNLQKDYQEMLQSKNVLEDQIQTLEKELENSTEVGLELNRMLSEILSSQSGSETLVANIEQLQRQLVEQQGTINSINATLNLKDTENHELQLELEIKNKKVIDLQAELDKMALNFLKTEEEKDQIQTKLEAELQTIKEQLDTIKSSQSGNKNKFSEEIGSLKKRCSELQKSLDLKSSEYNILKENFNQVKTVKNNKDILKDLLQCTTFKAEVIELQKENKTLNDLLAQERQIKVALEQRTEAAVKEMDDMKTRYDDADKEKLEAQTKLEVLGNYFKEKEAELQKELTKQESLWLEKQGEATTSTERIRYIQEELQNCKAQNELLKQEIVSQEVELKSQISVLEKKAHESWLSARQAERRLEDSKQEAAQLRNRLTLKERSFAEDKGQHRMQSPLEQNGDVASPLHMPIETPSSPPLLYSTRDHLTTSPPLPGLPPFLPPPPGVPPFMPPPMPGVPGFMPPPPSMFPVDHRPPPLGRMSSPPLNSRYSPDSRYSPYDDRNSPSPPPYEHDYRAATPPRHNRSYSPYRDERREYSNRAGSGRTNGRSKGISSGSENSNSETIDRTNNRHHTKI